MPIIHQHRKLTVISMLLNDTYQHTSKTLLINSSCRVNIVVGFCTVAMYTQYIPAVCCVNTVAMYTQQYIPAVCYVTTIVAMYTQQYIPAVCC